MKKIFTLLTAFAISALSAQEVLEKFPAGQQPYTGGHAAFYQDFHRILIDKKMQPCQNKKEVFPIWLIVYPDAKIKFIKPTDTLTLAKNKCAYELSKNVLKYMTAWKPAEVDGQKVAAATYYYIIPDDLFENYKPGYDAAKLVVPASYEGGVEAFRKKVFSNINLADFNFREDVSVTVYIDIDEQGNIIDISLEEPTANEDFNERIIRGVRSIKSKWHAATVHGIPHSSRITMPMTVRAN